MPPHQQQNEFTVVAQTESPLPVLDSPFPNGCHQRWLAPNTATVAALPAQLKHWLLDRGSLTARLKAHYHDVRVDVLRQEVAPVSPDEQQQFGGHGPFMQVREILLVCDDIPRVFARTLLPETTLNQSQADFRQLGSRPLGEVLFQTEGMQRGAIEVGCFEATSTIGRLARQAAQPPGHPLWGRRSLFHVDDQPLLVAEIFLPQAPAYPNHA